MKSFIRENFKYSQCQIGEEKICDMVNQFQYKDKGELELYASQFIKIPISCIMSFINKKGSPVTRRALTH